MALMMIHNSKVRFWKHSSQHEVWAQECDEPFGQACCQCKVCSDSCKASQSRERAINKIFQADEASAVGKFDQPGIWRTIDKKAKQAGIADNAHFIDVFVLGLFIINAC